MRITAEHADIWHGFGDVETMQELSGVLDDWCETRSAGTCEIERSTSIRQENVDDVGALVEPASRTSSSRPTGRTTTSACYDVLAWRESFRRVFLAATRADRPARVAGHLPPVLEDDVRADVPGRRPERPDGLPGRGGELDDLPGGCSRA